MNITNFIKFKNKKIIIIMVIILFILIIKFIINNLILTTYSIINPIYYLNSNRVFYDKGDNDSAKDNYIIYKGIPYYVDYIKKEYFNKTADSINKFNKFSEYKNIAVMPIPTKSTFVTDKYFIKKIGNQKQFISDFFDLIEEPIIRINCLDELEKHKNENIYFESDKHLTALGSYYSYIEFCKKMNIEHFDLNEFDELLLKSEYKGSIFDETNDFRTKIYSDEVYAYLPKTKSHMKILTADDRTLNFDTTIVNYNKGYGAFINGDSKLVVIETEVDNDKTLYVVKDSFANSIIPFLTMHYKKIVVLDTTYTDDLKYCMDLLNEEKILFDDVLILTSFYKMNHKNFSLQLEKALGIENNKILKSKFELFLNFYKDFYDYINSTTEGKNDLINNNISNLNDFYMLNLTWTSGVKGMGRVGEITGKYFMKKSNVNDLNSQLGQDVFIGYCLENNIYIEFIKYLQKYFYEFRRAERLIEQYGQNAGNFFFSPNDSIIDTSKLFYYTEDSLLSFFKNDRVFMEYFKNVPLLK